MIGLSSVVDLHRMCCKISLNVASDARPLRTCAIPEHLRGVFTARRYTHPRLPDLTWHDLDYLTLRESDWHVQCFITLCLLLDWSKQTVLSASHDYSSKQFCECQHCHAVLWYFNQNQSLHIKTPSCSFATVNCRFLHATLGIINCDNYL